MYLKQNYEKIKDVICGVWSHKENQLIRLKSIDYDEDAAQIRVVIDLNADEKELIYCDADHNKGNDKLSLASFLADFNTDIGICELILKYPTLSIEGCSWPDDTIYLANGIDVKNFKTFYSPYTGIFNINQFLLEKSKGEKQSPLLLRGFVNELSLKSSKLESFQATYIIDPALFGLENKSEIKP